MPSVDDTPVEDRDILVEERFNRMQESYLRTLVNDAIIAEHRRQPLGHHSEPLERILMHFRRAAANKYALKRDTDGGYHIVSLSGVRGVRPSPVAGAAYKTIEEAYHGLFLKQLDDMLGS